MKTFFAFALSAVLLLAQPPDRTKGGRPPGGRGPTGPEAISIEDRTGFEPIFDGKTLSGWDGDPALWRVENETIVGETTAANPIKLNSFLIWRGGKPANFELKLELKMNSTNSGIQYRSVELPEVGKWVLKGYQADFDFINQHTGLLYEERGRGFLAPRGIVATKEGDGRPRTLAQLKSADDLKGAIKINDWNTVHIIARDNVLMHIFNGQLVSAFIDDDTAGRKMEGLLGFQIHVGPPMKLEIRKVGLKKK
ncbi:MAG: DUF1080 domain-containing protein [Acidobacteria bacterium]|nr:DUF1080 domain-containing protein [Acidobacteriota bacterium]